MEHLVARDPDTSHNIQNRTKVEVSFGLKFVCWPKTWLQINANIVLYLLHV